MQETGSTRGRQESGVDRKAEAVRGQQGESLLSDLAVNIESGAPFMSVGSHSTVMLRSCSFGSQADDNDEEAKDTNEASEKAASLRPGAPKEVEAAAEDIVESGAKPIDEHTGKVSDSTVQDTAGPAEVEPGPADSPKASSKSQHSAPSAAGKQAADHSVGSAGKSDKAAQDTTIESGPAASTRKSRHAKVHHEESSSDQIATLPASEPVLEAEAPATAATTSTDATMLPKTDGAEAASDAAAQPAQPHIPDVGSAQDAAAPVAMDVEPVRKAPTPTMPDVSEPEAATTTAISKAADEATPLAAAETDASRPKASSAAEDVEMVQYDEPSNDNELAAAKQQGKAESKASDGKPSESSRSHRDRHASTSKAAKVETAAHGSVRKREREFDESAQVDRKAPRTDHKSASQKEKERERAKDKDKEREKTQAHGSGATGKTVIFFRAICSPVSVCCSCLHRAAQSLLTDDPASRHALQQHAAPVLCVRS